MSMAANPQAEAGGQTKVRQVSYHRIGAGGVEGHRARRGLTVLYEGRLLIGGSSSPAARSRADQKIHTSRGQYDENSQVAQRRASHHVRQKSQQSRRVGGREGRR